MKTQRYCMRADADAHFGLMTAAVRGLALAVALFLPGVSLAVPPTVPPVPIIQNVSPPSATPPASMDVMLTLIGTGFSNGDFTPISTVQFSGPAGTAVLTPAKADFSNCGFVGVCEQVAVTVPKANIVAGTAVITLINPFPINPPTPLVSNAFLFPMSAFENTIAFGNASAPVGNGPRGVANGDFDGDGKEDLAIVNTNDNSVSILLGNGDGTFSPASGSAIMLGNNLQPVAVAVGDFNNDGKLDLAVVNENDNSISVLLGKGDGTFTVQNTRTNTSGLNPVALAVIDLDGDGNDDLAVVNQTNQMGSTCGTNGSLALLQGAGDGTFSLLASPHFSEYTFVNGVSPNPICLGAASSSVAVGDFNGDGVPDLVVTNGGGGNATCNPGVGTVSIVVNGTNFEQSSCGLCPPPPAPPAACAGKSPSAVAVADFDNDGKFDLAVADVGDNSVSILLGNGDATFKTPLNFPTGSLGPTGVIVGDFDSDQKLDVAILHQGGGAVAILRGDNKGNFSAANGSPFAAGDVPGGFAVADFNGDGRLDIAASNSPNTISIMLQNPPLSFSPASIDFRNVPENTASTPQNITITNNSGSDLTIPAPTIVGPNASAFAVVAATTGTPCSFPQKLTNGGGNCAIAVTFTPNTIAAFAAAVRVSEPTGISQFVSLIGNGLAPVLSPSPLDMTFGATLIGTMNSNQQDGTPAVVTVTNVGAADANITAVAITGANAADFTTNDTCTGKNLKAGSGSCTVGVTFAPGPGNPGLRTAQVSITYDIGSGPIVLIVGLGGEAAAPLVSVTNSPVTFGNQQVGTTSAGATVTLSNLGTWPLTFSGTGAISGANAGDFSILSNNCASPLAVSTSCSVTITFTPAAMIPPLGPRTAVLTFTDNDKAVNNSAQMVTLTGTATAPVVSLSSSSLSFGGVPVTTTSAPISFLLTNVGTAPLAISAPGIAIGGANAGDFSESDNCPRSPSTLAVNANCAITIRLTPSATGLRSATLSITDNNMNSPGNFAVTAVNPQTVSLSGTGTDFSLSASPGSVTVSPGKFATYTLTITPISGFTATLSLACSVTPAASKTTCTVPNSVAVNGMTAVTSISAKNSSKGRFTLTFTGTFTATAPASGTLQHQTTATLIVK